MAERPQPYGTGEYKDGNRNSETKVDKESGSQQNPSTSKGTPYRRP